MKKPAILTVDFEDYRRQELRDYLGDSTVPPFPREVERQTEIFLSIFEKICASATIFCVGRLTKELNSTIWGAFGQRHAIGCHGHEHTRVFALGPKLFRADLRQAKQNLEDRTGNAVLSYRAPYFSADGCDPWFGESLSENGFLWDSSHRLASAEKLLCGTYQLAGSHGKVLEIPLFSIGWGAKRITVIGGTYFRIFPLYLIKKMLKRAEALGFIPLIYLHPYDFDPKADPLEFGSGYPFGTRFKGMIGDSLRRAGRVTTCSKLEALALEYEFKSIEDYFRISDGVSSNCNI